MPESLADWAVWCGVLLWNCGILGGIWWFAQRGRPSWQKPVRAPKVTKERITSDWRPMV